MAKKRNVSAKATKREKRLQLGYPVGRTLSKDIPLGRSREVLPTPPRTGGLVGPTKGKKNKPNTTSAKTMPRKTGGKAKTSHESRVLADKAKTKKKMGM